MRILLSLLFLAPVLALGQIETPATGGTATSLSSGTNTVYFTNNCYVSTNVNTQVINVYGAGTSAANGDYRTNTANGFFTNTASAYQITNDGVDWFIVPSLGGAALYSQGTFPAVPVGAWALEAGANPVPTSQYGPVTNCFGATVAIPGFELPVVSTNLYISESLGNDTNAVRGRIDRKFRTFAAALAVSVAGDTFCFDPGDYPSSSGSMLYNQKLIGSGRGVTRLNSPGGSENRLRPKSGSYIGNLTFYGAINYGLGAPDSTSDPVTNGVIENCDIIGISDGIEADVWHSLRFENCFIVSTYDGIADWDFRPGGSNRVMKVKDCDILVTNGSFSTLHGISGGDSRIEVEGGSITVLNGPSHNNCIYLSVDTYRTNKTGSVLLSGTRLRSLSTNNSAPFVTNFNNLPVFMDNCTMETVTATYTAGCYTNQWSDRFVAMPNGSARSNRLPDIRTLTNGLMQATPEGFQVTIFDQGNTASGTNLYVLTAANQKINFGPVQTNISANSGSMTFAVSGTNWIIRASYP